MSGPPSEKVDFEAASAAYSDKPPLAIEDWTLAPGFTPTIKAYVRSKWCLVCVRGTADKADVWADAAIAINTLSWSQRYKSDLQYVRSLITRFPGYTFSLCGHSLGSAVSLQLMKDMPGVFQGAVEFNGALQPSDLLRQTPGVKEVYASKDPLFNIAGRLWNNKQVLDTPGVNPLVAHKLTSLRSLFDNKSGGGRKRRRCCGGDDGSELAKREATPLSDDDLRVLLPGIKISTYPDLARMSSIDDLLDAKGQGILLELTTSANDGHWTLVQREPNGFSFFSSFGKPPDWELAHWLSPETRTRLHESNPDLSRLLEKAQADGAKVTYNAVKLQGDGNIATCGRWAAVRALLGDLSLPDFRALVAAQEHGETGDAFVTLLTDKLLQGDRSALDELSGGAAPAVPSQENKHLSLKFMIAHRAVKTVKPGVLTVAAYPNFRPVSYEEGGVFHGLDVDVMKALAKQLGLNVEFVRVSEFDGIWELPAQNKADVAIGGIANLASRTGKETEWSIPYFYVDRSIMFRRDAPISSFPGGLDVHKPQVPILGTFNSTGWIDGLERLKRAGLPAGVMQRGTSDAADVRALEDGHAQGVMRGSFVSKALVKGHPDLDYTQWTALPDTVPSDGEVFAYPTRLGSGLAVVLSTFIAELVSDGELVKLMRKWGLA